MRGEREDDRHPGAAGEEQPSDPELQRQRDELGTHRAALARLRARADFAVQIDDQGAAFAQPAARREEAGRRLRGQAAELGADQAGKVIPHGRLAPLELAHDDVDRTAQVTEFEWDVIERAVVQGEY
ncbi:MAG: hypothetical protein U0527_10720 [Candidatus Eisenbacteria bacterium]